jgi:hypothetical protein
MSGLSRRSLIASAAAVAAGTPAIAGAPAVPASACTLPPDLIERFVRVRAWYLDDHKQNAQW